MDDLIALFNDYIAESDYISPFYHIDLFNDMLSGVEPLKLVSMLGDFYPHQDYFTENSYGEFDSIDYQDVLVAIREHTDDSFITWLIDNEHIDLGLVEEEMSSESIQENFTAFNSVEHLAEECSEDLELLDTLIRHGLLYHEDTELFYTEDY